MPIITLLPTKDSTILKNSSTNYGTLAYYHVMRTTDGKGGVSTNRSVLTFEVPSEVDPASVIAARLHLVSQSTFDGSVGIMLSRLTEPWTEYNVSWINRTSALNWTTQGGTYAAWATPVVFQCPALRFSTDLDLTTVVVEGINSWGRLLDIHLRLVDEATLSDQGETFKSRESTSPDTTKLIIVTAPLAIPHYL